MFTTACRRLADGLAVHGGLNTCVKGADGLPTGCLTGAKLGHSLTGADGMPTGADGSFVCSAIMFSPSRAIMFFVFCFQRMFFVFFSP